MKISTSITPSISLLATMGTAGTRVLTDVGMGAARDQADKGAEMGKGYAEAMLR